MKNGLVVLSVVVAAFVLSTNLIYADGVASTQAVTMTVEGSSLIRVDGGAVELSLQGAATAGAAVTAVATSSNTRLSLSSLTKIDAVTSIESKNTISAQITSTATMYGSNTELYLRLLEPANLSHFINYDPAGNGLTNPGATAPAGALFVCNQTGCSPITLVSNIGTCWSGTALNDGYVIEYTYKTTGAGAPQNRSITVTFTIASES